VASRSDDEKIRVLGGIGDRVARHAEEDLPLGYYGASSVLDRVLEAPFDASLLVLAGEGFGSENEIGIDD
jgi:hypothetical protein